MAEIQLPQLGESVTEGTITKWFKQVGDTVAEDEVLFEVSTDKVDSEVPSPVGGVLSEIRVPEGDTVDVGTVIAVIGGDGAAPAPEAPEAGGRARHPRPAPGRPRPPNRRPLLRRHSPRRSPTAPAPPSPLRLRPARPPPRHRRPLRRRHRRPRRRRRPARGPHRPAAAVAHRAPAGQRLRPRPGRASPAPAPAGASPAPTCEAAIRTARPARLGPRSGSRAGPGPRARARGGARRRAAPRPGPGGGPRPAPRSGTGDTVEPLNNIRRRTGEHMVMSKQTSPHAYTVVEVDYENVERVRRRHRETWRDQEGFSLTYLPFISRAVIDALRDFPHMNATVGDGELVVHNYVNLSIAVDLDFEGLLAPVIHEADDKRLRAIARDINDLAGRARTKKLSADDISGGTFTLSNSGSFGSYLVLPIINQPQVAILSTDGVHRKPVVVTDARRRRVDRHPLGRAAGHELGPPGLRRRLRRRLPAGGQGDHRDPRLGGGALGDRPGRRPNRPSRRPAAGPLARDGALRRGPRPPARPVRARRATTGCCCSSTRTSTRSAPGPTWPTCSCPRPRWAPSWSGPTGAATSPTTARVSWSATRS